MPALKIKVGDLIIDLIDDAKKIERSKDEQRIKTQQFKRLAASFINKLYADKRKKTHEKISVSTARNYLTRARKALKEFLGLHHRFNIEISKLLKRYPHFERLIASLADLCPGETQTRKSYMLKNLLKSNELLEKIVKFNFRKPNVKIRLEKLANDYDLFSTEILALEFDSFANKNILMRMLNDHKEIYADIKNIKVDHELITSLRLDEADKDMLNNKESMSLFRKKKTIVYVDYTSYLTDINTILQQDISAFNGYVHEMSPLIFALSAATGRRPIEIIYTGSFAVKSKHSLLFVGQAKKRDETGVDERLIYTLIDSKVVLNAFNALRSLNGLSGIIKRCQAGNLEDNSFRGVRAQINGILADPLNQFAKKFFIDKKRVFKDTRGIYGRICHSKWFLIDKRWENKDEDIFFQELFGHSDIKSQAHYKPYRLRNFADDFSPGSENNNDRWRELCELDNDMIELARGDAAVKIHTKVKNMVLIDQKVIINQNVLIEATGSFRGTIKNYLNAIGPLSEPGEPLTTQIEEDAGDEEIVTRKKSKPKFNAKKNDDGNWDVAITYKNDLDTFNVSASNQMEAMKISWELLTGEIFEFDVTIPFKNHPYFKITLYAKSEKSAEMAALNFSKLDGFSGKHGKIKTKKNDV